MGQTRVSKGLWQISLELAPSPDQISVWLENGILHDQVWIEESYVCSYDVDFYLDNYFQLQNFRFINFLDYFPKELSLYILSLLPNSSLRKFSQVCKKAYSFVEQYKILRKQKQIKKKY